MIADARLHAVAGALGAFTRSRLAMFEAGPVQRENGSPIDNTFLLSHEELATLWHPPTAGVEPERMQVSAFTECEAPTVLPSGTEDGAVPHRPHPVPYRSARGGSQA